MNEAPLPFCAALIAGGKSTRMGRDKRLIEIKGRPLWLRQIGILQSLQPDELVISGEPDGPWTDSRHVIVPDAMANAGPLAGISGVLATARSPMVLILAVDMPQMTGEFLRSLLDRCTSACGVVPVRAEWFEPLAAVYPRDCAALAVDQLHSGNFSLQSFVQDCVHAGLLRKVDITPQETDLFHNLNTPEDLSSGSS